MKPASEDSGITELTAQFVTVLLNLLALSPVTSPTYQKKMGLPIYSLEKSCLREENLLPNMYEWYSIRTIFAALFPPYLHSVSAITH